MSEIVNYIERLENSNFDILEDNYHRYLANNLTHVLDKIEKNKRELKTLQDKVDRFEYLQQIRKNPTTYTPGIPLRPSRLEITKNKHNKEKIGTLKVEIQRLEKELRG